MSNQLHNDPPHHTDAATNARRVRYFHRARTRSKLRSKAPGSPPASQSKSSVKSRSKVSETEIIPILLFVIIAATASTYNQQPTVSMRNATMLHPTMQQTSDEQADEATTEINDTMIHGWATANQTLQHDESLPRTPTVPQEFLPTSVRRPAPKSPYFLHYVPKKGKRKKHANTTATLSAFSKPHPPTKPANVLKYEQTSGSQINVHEKYPLSLFNFGIELESCISSENYAPDMSTFELGSDSTISCRRGSSNVEYRYRGVHTFSRFNTTG